MDEVDNVAESLAFLFASAEALDEMDKDDDGDARFKGILDDLPAQAPSTRDAIAHNSCPRCYRYDKPGVILIGDGNTLTVRHLASGAEFRFTHDRVTVGKVNGGRALFAFTKKIIDSEQERTEDFGHRAATDGAVYQWVCAHGIGHGDHPHACDGCCDDPSAWTDEDDIPYGNNTITRRTTMPVTQRGRSTL